MRRLLNGFLIAVALCCALAGRTATTTISAATLDDPQPTCTQIYEQNNAQAWANYDYCRTHSGGNFFYLQGCQTQLAANLAANLAWYTLNC